MKAFLFRTAQNREFCGKDSVGDRAGSYMSDSAYEYPEELEANGVGNPGQDPSGSHAQYESSTVIYCNRKLQVYH